MLREAFAKRASTLIVTMLNTRITRALRQHGDESKNLMCSAYRGRSAVKRRLLQLLRAIVIISPLRMTPQTICWMTFTHYVIPNEVRMLVDANMGSLLGLNGTANHCICRFSSAAVRGTIRSLFCSWRQSSYHADLSFPWKNPRIFLPSKKLVLPRSATMFRLVDDIHAAVNPRRRNEGS